MTTGPACYNGAMPQSIEPLEKTHIVLHHGRCPDGLGAAWAARQVLGDSADYIPMEYDTSPRM